MARAPIAGSATSGAARNRIVLTAPAANTTVNYNAPSSRTFVLQGFEPGSGVDFVRNGTNLELRFDDGAVINLVRYFAVGRRSLANFETQDGNLLAGKDFLQNFAPTVDATPAAGPVSTPSVAPGGSGVGEYRGEFGALIGGVEVLGSLGTDYWDDSTLSDREDPDALDRFNDISIGDPFRGDSFVNEAGLPNGSNPGYGLESEWESLVLPDGITIVGVPLGGSAQFEGQYATLHVRHLGGSSYEYMYVLKNPFTSAEADNGTNLEIDAEYITLQITNGRDTGTIQVAVNIQDDIPEAVLGQGQSEYTHDSGEYYSGYEITGDWSVGYGADGGHAQRPMEILVAITPVNADDSLGTPVQQVFNITVGQPVDLVINGVNYGSITFAADGTYSFTPASDTKADYNIRFGARDGDGDLSYNGDGLTFPVRPPDPEIAFGDEWFSEANLSGGTAADPTQVTKEIELPNGYTINVNEPSSNGAVWQEKTDADGNTYYVLEDSSAYGYLSYYPPAGSGENYQPPRLTYTLTQNALHGLPDGSASPDKNSDPSQTFFDINFGELTLQDSGGNNFKVPTSFTIYDDAPVVNFDAVSATEITSGHDVLGTWSVVFGADGPKSTNSRVLIVRLEGSNSRTSFDITVLENAAAGEGTEIKIGDVVYGYIKFIQSGDFIFTAAPNLTANLVFSLTGSDRDIDQTTQSFTVSITPPSPPKLELKDPTPIDENNLTEDGNGDDLIREIIVPPGYVIDTDKDGWKEHPTKPGQFQKPTEDGTGMLTYNPDDNTLNYELKNPIDHGGATVVPDIVDEITLVDDKGNTFTGNPVEVPILDDKPTVDIDLENNTSVPGGPPITGEFEVDFGGDGKDDTGTHPPVEIEVIVDGNEQTFVPPTDGSTVTYPVVDGNGDPVGELEVTVDEDGKGHFEFKPDPGAKPGTDVEINIVGKDKDGTPAESGGVDISIVDPDGPGVNFLGNGVELYEAHLADGTAWANGAGLTKSIDLPDGFVIDTTGWTRQADGTYVLPKGTGNYGYLSCDADGKNLTYTLTDKATHEDGKGNNSIRDTIPDIVIVDGDGTKYTLPVKVTVIDDIPEVALGGSDTVSNAIQSGSTYEGQWALKYGADGEAGTTPLQLTVYLGSEKATISVVPGTKTAVAVGGVKYGDILFDSATGKYTFTAAANQEGTLRFELTATDQDGDQASDSHVIKIEKKTGPGVDYITVDENPDEANLPDGTDANSSELTKPVPLPPGFVVDTDQGGWTPDGKGNYELKNPDGPGHLTYNPKDNTLEYTLDKQTEHPDKGVDELPIYLKDEDGNTFPVDVVVPIENDIPEAALDGPENTIESGSSDPLTGTWEVNFGADDAASDKPLVLVISKPGCETPQEITLDPSPSADRTVSVEIDGTKYGTLTIKPNGTFEFVAEKDLDPTRLDLVLKATDSDGDTVTTPPFVISITPADGPDIGYLTTVTGEPFDEANFLSGTNPNSAALTKELNLPDGYTVDVTQDGWERERGTDRYVFKSPVETDANGVVINGFGQLTYDTSTGKLTYTLTNKVFNTPAENDLGTDSIPGLTVLDANGNSFTIDAVVDIRDDKPELTFEGDAVVKAGATYEGDWSYNFGADGSADAKAMVIKVSDGVLTKEYTVAVGSDTEISLGGTRYGALSLGSDGKYTFKAEPNVSGELSIYMTITDSDGDQVASDTPLVIKIESETREYETGPADGKGIYESNLSDGTAPDSGKLTKVLELPKDSNGDLLVPDVTGWSNTGSGIYIKKGPTGYLKWDSGKEELTFTLEDSSLHPIPGQSGDNDSLTNTMQISVKDPDGNTYTATVKVPVYDDAPLFSNPELPDQVESGTVFSGNLGLNYGADGKSALTSDALMLKIWPDPSDLTKSVTIPLMVGKTQDVYVNGTKYGAITINADYSYSFDLEANLPGNFLIDFGATDADGDTSWAFGGKEVEIKDPINPGDLTGTTVSEIYLPDGTAGSDPGAGAQLVQNVAIPDGFTIDTSSGWTGKGSGLFEMKSPYGTLTYDSGKNSLTYTLDKPLDHPDADKHGADDVLNDIFNVVIKNQNGHKFDVKAEIHVRDDAPELSMTAPTTGVSGHPVTGDWNVHFGADGAGTAQGGSTSALDIELKIVLYKLDAYGQPERDASGNYIVDKEITGLRYDVPADYSAIKLADSAGNVYGELTLNQPATGQYTFTPAPNICADYYFVLGATDGDGDRITSGDDTPITITPPSIIPPVVPDDALNEANLPGGTDPNSAALTSTITIPADSQGNPFTVVMTPEWDLQSDDSYQLVKGGGYLTYKPGTNELSYTLKDPFTHPAQGADDLLESIDVVWKDSLGNTFTVPVTPTIKDDIPETEIKVDSNAVGSGASVNGSFKLDEFGADGQATSEYLALVITDSNGPVASFTDAELKLDGSPLTVGKYGTLTIDANGNFVFKANPNVSGSLVLTVTAKDADGDTDSSSVDLAVNMPKGPDIVVGQGDGEYFNEANLEANANYGQDYHGSSSNSALLVKNIYTAGLLVDTNSADGWQLVAGSTDTWTLQGDNGFYTYKETGSGTTAKGQLTYTFTNAAEHADPSKVGADDKGYDEFSKNGTAGYITLKDGLGNTWLVPTKITMYDDGPKIESFDGPSEAYSGVDYTCTLSFVHGADGPDTKGRPLVLNYSYGANSGTLVLDAGQSKEVTLQDGSKAVFTYQNGKLTLTPPANNTGTWELEAIVTDGDGDTDAKKLTVSVAKKPAPTDPITAVDPLDEANLPDGTNSPKGSLTTELQLPAGFTVETGKDGWTSTATGFTKNVPGRGVLEYQNGKLTFTLNDNLEHSAAGNDWRDVDFGTTTITIKDQYGNEYVAGEPGQPGVEVSIDIPVLDDVPAGIDHHVNQNVVTPGDSISGSLDAAPNYGADGEHATEPLKVQVALRGSSEAPFLIDIAPDGTEVEVKIGNVVYGYLKLNANYSYEFSVPANSPNVNAQLDISYVLKDGDGDETWSNVDSISIKPVGSIPFDLTATVYENELPAGSGPSSTNPVVVIDVPAAYKADNWAIWIDATDPDWSGSAAAGYTCKTAHGTLNFRNGVLTYTLDNAAKHADGLGANSFYEAIADKIFVTDNLGNNITTPVYTEIRIVDDLPVVSFGKGIAEPDVTSGDTYEGYWSVNYGADGAATDAERLQLIVSDGTPTGSVTINVTEGVAATVTIGGVTYGTITLDASTGKYAFSAASDITGTLSFKVSAKDSDGDIVQSDDGFAITIKGGTPPPDTLSGEGPVNEAHLSTGTQPTGASVMTEITLPTGYTLDTTGWTTEGTGLRFDQAGKSGHLFYDNGKLYFVLDSGYDHPDGGGRQIGVETINNVVLKDSNGNSYSVDVEVDVQDDIPAVQVGGAQSVESGSSCAGTWSVTPGADGLDGTAPYAMVIKDGSGNTVATITDLQFGTPYTVGSGSDIYGQIVVNSNGTYEFTAQANTQGSLTFTLQAKDADGDTSGGDHTILIQSPDTPILQAEVYEENLLQGSNPNAGALTQILIDNAGGGNYSNFKVDITQGGWEKTATGWVMYTLDSSGGLSSRGQLICDTDPSDPNAGLNLRYELLQPLDHAPGQGGAGDIGYDTSFPNIVLVDDKGNKHTTTPTIKVHDDEPHLNFGSQTSGNVISGDTYDGTYDLSFGADGSPKDGTFGVEVKVQLGAGGTGPSVTLGMNLGSGSTQDVVINNIKYGELTLDDTGNFTFKAEPNITAALRFDMTVTDGDGDVVKADSPFVLHIEKPTPVIPDLTYQEPVNETHLPNGQLPDSSQLNRNVQMTRGYVVDVSQDGWVAEGYDSALGYHVFTKTGTYGKLTYYAADTDNYTAGDHIVFTLTKNAPHTLPGTEADVIFNSTMGGIHFKDALGNTYDVGTKFPIQDDLPVVDLGADATLAGGDTLNGTYQGTYGADGPASTNSIRVKLDITDVSDPNNHFTFTLESGVVIGQPVTLTYGGVQYGTLTFTSTSEYVFHAGNNVSAQVQLSLSLTDGDGDTTTDTKQILINTDDPGKVNLTGSVNEANLVVDPTAGQDYAGSNPNAALLTQTIILPALPGGQQGTYGIQTSPAVTSALWEKDTSGQDIWTLQTQYGYLTYSETGANPSLTFTLQKAPTEAVGMPGYVLDIPDIMIKDALNNSYDAALKVTIADDTPSLSMTQADAVQSGATYTDGIWTANFGADGPSAGGMTLEVTDKSGATVTLTGIQADTDITVTIGTVTYGTLRLDSATNTFTFAAANNIEDQLDFSLTIVDGDGDAASADFSLTITKDAPIILTATVDEKHLAQGSSPNGSLLSQEIDLQGRTVDLDPAAGWTRPSPTSPYMVLQVDSGYLMATLDGSRLYYELDSAYKHGAPSSATDASALISTSIVLIDSLNNSALCPVRITVLDDTPAVEFGGAQGDPAYQHSMDSGALESYPGGFQFTFGADGSATQNGLVLTYTITAEDGTVTTKHVTVSPDPTSSQELKTDSNELIGVIRFDQASNQFSFQAAANIGVNNPVVVDMQLTATDGDGDVVTSGHVEISIKKPDGPPTDNIADGVVFLEEHLSGGTNESTNSADTIKTINIPGGGIWIPDTTGWTQETSTTWSMTGSFGTGKLIWDGTELKYQFLNPGTHTAQGKDFGLDDFPNFQLQDALGNTYEVDCTVTIQDDAPLVTWTVNAGDVIPGQNFGGEWSYKHGADGEAATDGLVLEVTVGGHTVTLSGADLKLDGTAMDILGQDGTLWGILTMQNNGTYNYQAQANKPGTVSFNLTAKDVDGDITSANGSKDVGKSPIVNWKLGEDQFFDEANLEAATGQYPGTNPSSNNLEKTLYLHGYSIQPSTADGWVETTAGIWHLQGGNGYLIYNEASKVVSFRLTSNASHAKPGVIGSSDVFIDSFLDGSGSPNLVTIVDNLGNTQQVEIAINIHDDGPRVREFQAQTGDLTSGKDATGNFSFDYGADGPASSGSLVLRYQLDGGQVEEVEITLGQPVTIGAAGGPQATVTFRDGSYTFTPASDTNATWSLTVIAKDGDQDTASSSQVNFVVKKPVYTDVDLTIKDAFDESFLPGGTNEGGSLVKNFDLKGLSVDTSQGGWTQVGSNWELATTEGKFIYTSSGTLSYEVTAAHGHPAPGGSGWDLNNDAIAIGNTVITLLDQYGNSYKAGQGSGNDFTISMTVRDDAPAPFTLGEDYGNVQSGDSYSGTINLSGTASGQNPLKVGADGSGGNGSKGDGFTLTATLGGTTQTITLDGIGITGGSQDVVIGSTNYGTLTMGADGKFTFATAGNTNGNAIIFEFTLEDADGDTHSKSVEVNISDSPVPPRQITFANNFDERYLDDGTAPNPSMLTQTTNGPAGFTVINDGTWTEDPSAGTLVRENATGKLTYNIADNTFTYQLKDNVTHPDANSRDTLEVLLDGISLQDVNNNTFTNHLTVKVTIVDDVPVIDADNASVASGQPDYIGTWTHNFGADGHEGTDKTVDITVTVASTGQSETLSIIVGQSDDLVVNGINYGKLTLGANGTYTFAAEPNITENLNLNLSITDGDGDSGDASFTIQITKPTVDTTDPLEGGEVNEALLPDGTGVGGGSTSTVIDLSDATSQGLTLDTSAPGWVQGPTGTFTNATKDPNGTLVYDQANNTLTYTLDNPLDHPNTAGRDRVTEVIQDIVFVDANGNAYDFDVQFTVVDDAPVVTVTDKITISQGATDSSGTWSVAHGADGNDLGANDHFSVVIKAGNNQLLTVDDYTPGATITIPGYGTVTFEPGGSVTFVGSPNSEFDIDITISAKDSDGDTSSATLNVVSVDSSTLNLPTAELFEENLGHGSNPDSSALVFWINPTDTSHANYNAENVKYTVDLNQGDWKPLAGNSNVYYLGDVDANGTPLGAGLLLCDADGTNLRYELSNRHPHDSPPAGVSSDKNSAQVLFDQVVFRDSLDNEYKPPIRVTIVDDIPEVAFNVSSGSVNTGATYTPAGTDDYKLQFGADGSPDAKSGIHLDVTFTDASGQPVGSYSIEVGTGSIPITINGRTYGTLVLNEGNRFEFIANPALASDPVGLLGTFNFTLKVTDRDGDTTDPASFELELHKPDITGVVPPTDLNVQEANLVDGTSPDPGGLTKTWDLGNNTVDTSSWNHAGGTVYTKTTGTGVLTYDTSDPNKIVYTLTDNDKHAAQGKDDLEHAFSGVVFLDPDGNAYSYEIKVNVVDDVPVLGDGVDETIDESSVGAGGNPFTSEGSFQVLLGADGVDGNTAGYFTLTLQVESFSSKYPGVTPADTEIQIPRNGTQGTPIIINTKLGVLLLEYDNATNQISYSYQAHRGSKDDYEKISYSVVDTDGDLVEQDFTITLAEDVKEGHLHLSESALPFGSNNPLNTVGIQDETELLGIAFEGGTVAIEWDIAAIEKSYNGFLLEADGNQDGEYQQVVWSTDGITLTGTADGVVVFRATAIFTNDTTPLFTGRITAELSAAFKHNKSADDLDLSFDLKFTQISSNKERVESTVKVTIDDDSPYSGKNTQPIYVEEIPERYEEVFITLDCSETMDWGAQLGDGRTRKDVTVDALIELMEAYQANGINAKFTLIGFAHIATVNPEFSGITAGEFLDLYQALVDTHDVQYARDTIWSLIRQDHNSDIEFGTPGNMTAGIGTWTNYEAGTEQLINELNKAMADPERNSAEKTVFFMTDGQSSFGDPKSWYEYLSQHSGEFDVYTIGMSSEIGAEDENRLVEMADGKSENFVLVKDFNKLSEILQGFIKPVTGSLLDNLGSADVNTLSEIWIAAAGLTDKADVLSQGTNYKINSATGHTDEITIGTGADAIKLVIYADGTYRVVAGNVTEDIPQSIVIAIKDADGDEITTEVIELVIKDAKPTAYDNVAEYDLYNGDTSNLSADGGGFSQADNMSGNWNLTNAEFIAASGSGVSITDTGLPSSLIGSHYLHLEAAGMTDDSAYFEHMGHKMFLWDLVETGLGIDLTEISGPTAFNPGTWGYYSMASHTVTAVSGTISFNWHARGSEGDYSFYFLVDSRGNIVDSEVLAKLGASREANGTRVIDIPMNDGSEEYTIVFGTLETSSDVDKMGNPLNASELFINAVVVEEDAYDYKGNILTDPSPTGDVDLMYDMATLYSIKVGNTEYKFDGKYQLEITTAYGILIVNKNGDYIYKVTSGDPKAVIDQFTYVIEDRDLGEDNRSEADLIIQWHKPVAVETVAGLNNGGRAFNGNVLTDQSLYGETDQCYTTSYLTSFTLDGKTVTFSGKDDGAQTITTSQGTLSIAADGTYTFTLNSGVNASQVNLKGTYTINDGDANQGSLLIKVVEPHAQDNAAESGEIYNVTEVLDTFASGTGSWNSVGVSGNLTTGPFPDPAVDLPDLYLATFLKPPVHSALTNVTDDNYLIISGVGALSGDQLQKLFDVTDHISLADRLNTMGLTADNVVGMATNTLQGSFASREFATTGGKLVFDWSFAGKQDAADADAAIYILQDASGNIVGSGTLGQLLNTGNNNVKKCGVAEIDIPVSADDQTYTLYVGTLQAGMSSNAAIGQSDSQLLIGSVVMQEELCHFAGNLLKDASPDGMRDFGVADGTISSITYNGTVYQMTGTEIKIATSSGGKLIVEADGSYRYSDTPGSSGNLVAENFEYTVKTAYGEDSAMLFIRGDAYKVESDQMTDIDLSSSGYANAPYLLVTGNNAEKITGGTNDNVIFAGGGDDTIFGGSGNDHINGGLGDDFISAGRGNNVLTGGAGADTFSWNTNSMSGTDVIKDFSTIQQDKLTFSDLLGSNESMDDFFRDHIKSVSLLENENRIEFTIQNGTNASKAVELNFTSDDSNFSQLVSDYNNASGSAQQELIVSFLIQHSITS